MKREFEKVRVKEIIVVEGFHDKQAVDAAVEADVWVAGGDRIARRFIEELKRASRHRGVLILTDPDGPGERIRRRISEAIPGVKHAFIPRKRATNSKGIGVEHAGAEDIRRAILAARPEVFTAERSTGGDTFTMDDLIEAGLVHASDAALKRMALGDILHLGYANAKSFLYKLNALGVTREEWEAALKQLKGT
jgi:ribonuclease M5